MYGSLLRTITLFFTVSTLFLLSTASVSAAVKWDDCSLNSHGVQAINGTINESFIEGEVNSLNFDINNLVDGTKTFTIFISRNNPLGTDQMNNVFHYFTRTATDADFNIAWSSSNNAGLFTLEGDETLGTGGERNIMILYDQFGVGQFFIGGTGCRLGTYTIIDKEFTCTADFKITQERTSLESTQSQTCFINENSCLKANDPFSLKITGQVINDGKPIENATVNLSAADGGLSLSAKTNKSGKYLIDKADMTFATKRTLRVFAGQVLCAEYSPDVQNFCPSCSTTPGTPDNGDLRFALCSQVGPSLVEQCNTCFDKEGSIWTAVGCIKSEPKAIIESVVQIGVGVGGGIALLMTLIGGFLLTTSQGDPKRTQEGKDMITSSVIGIIFVLFSVVVLQFVGVTVLRLPGFGVS